MMWRNDWDGLALSSPVRIVIRRTNTCSLPGREGAPGRTGKGSSMGRGACGIEAAAGVAERARSESRHPAVTLPAEWHSANGR